MIKEAGEPLPVAERRKASFAGKLTPAANEKTLCVW